MADIVLQGFHGTSEINGKSIAAMQQFRPSLGDAEWLGKGVYFFVDGISDPKEDAAKWARMRVRGGRKVVLSADIKTDTDRIFDLGTNEAIKVFNNVKTTHAGRISLPQNREKDWKGLVDTYVLGIICSADSGTTVDVIKKPCAVNFNGEMPSGVPNTTIACVVNGKTISRIRLCATF